MHNSTIYIGQQKTQPGTHILGPWLTHPYNAQFSSSGSNKPKGYACAILEAFGTLGYILSSVTMLCFAHTNLLV
jgi:hypothetical protein